MNEPLRIPVPHSLGKEEARRRIGARLPELQSHMPGGIADIRSSWIDEDNLSLMIGAMGQTVDCRIEVEDSRVVVNVALPPMLSFFGGAISSAVRDGAGRLLGPPKK